MRVLGDRGGRRSSRRRWRPGSVAFALGLATAILPALAAAGGGSAAAQAALPEDSATAPEQSAAEISAAAASEGPVSGPCASHGAMATGPLQVSAAGGESTVPRRACPRTELYGGLAGAALIDTPAFYGTLNAGMAIGGSLRYGRRGEVFVRAEILHFRFVQNATLTGSHLSAGLTSAGVTQKLSSGDRTAVAATGRLTLPTAFGRHEHAWPVHAGAGLTVAHQASPRITAHGQLSALAGVTVGSGPPSPRGGTQARAGIAASYGHVAGVADAGADLGYSAPLDRAYIAPGFRLAIWRELAAEVAVMVPFAGSDRTDAAFSLRAAWRH